MQTGQLLFQRCTACGTLRHPPAPMCGDCHSLEWDTQESRGNGPVYTWIVSHHPTRPDAEPRIVALVQLDDGLALRVEPAGRRDRRRPQRHAGRGLLRDHRRRRAPAVPAHGRRGPVTHDQRHRHRRHRPDRVLEALGPQRAAAGLGGDRRRHRRRRPHPRRHRRCGHLRHGRERRAGGDPHRGHPRAALHRPHARRRRRFVRHRAVGRGRGRVGRRQRGGRVPRVQRTVGSPVRAADLREQRGAGHPAGLELVPAVRVGHAGQGVLAVVPALHAQVRRDQRRLRALPGGGTQVRRDQPRRLLLPAAADARAAPAVALDRRADPAQARLLPGERRRGRHGGHERGPRARPSPPAGAPRRRHAVARARRRRDVRLLRRRPRRVPGGGFARRARCTKPPGSGPPTSTSP